MFYWILDIKIYLKITCLGIIGVPLDLNYAPQVIHATSGEPVKSKLRLTKQKTDQQ